MNYNFLGWNEKDEKGFTQDKQSKSEFAEKREIIGKQTFNFTTKLVTLN